MREGGWEEEMEGEREGETENAVAHRADRTRGGRGRLTGNHSDMESSSSR